MSIKIKIGTGGAPAELCSTSKENAEDTGSYSLFIKALQKAGFDVHVMPGEKLNRPISVALGNEKDFIDAISDSVAERFNIVSEELKKVGGSVEIIPGKGDQTIKYWGSLKINGKKYTFDFTYRVGDGLFTLLK